MKTIEDRWPDFRSGYVPPDAPPMQVSEMRIAFYGGFKSMLDANMKIALLDEEPAIYELEQLDIEARRFGASL